MEDSFADRPRQWPGREGGILGDRPRHGQRRNVSLGAATSVTRCCERDADDTEISEMVCSFQEIFSVFSIFLCSQIVRLKESLG